MRTYRPKKCSCGRSMEGYVENLLGTEWLERCEVCNKHKLRTWKKTQDVSPEAAAKIKATWDKLNGVKAHE